MCSFLVYLIAVCLLHCQVSMQEYVQAVSNVGEEAWNSERISVHLFLGNWRPDWQGREPLRAWGRRDVLGLLCFVSCSVIHHRPREGAKGRGGIKLYLYWSLGGGFGVSSAWQRHSAGGRQRRPADMLRLSRCTRNSRQCLIGLIKYCLWQCGIYWLIYSLLSQVNCCGSLLIQKTFSWWS